MNKNPVIEYKDLSELIFDPENPRLPSQIRGHDLDAKVVEWMILNENLTELMSSIAEKGFFPAEPLLVVKSQTKKNKFEVVEGNRRLAAIRLLNKPTLSKNRVETIREIVDQANADTISTKVPVILFDNKDELQVFLGYRHITGVKAWDALAKARYLDKLRDTLKLRNKKDEFVKIAKIIGSQPSHVKSLIRGLAIYNVIEESNFFDIPDLDETNVEFGVLYTAVGRENIAKFVNIDINSSNPTKGIKVRELKELSSWLFEKDNDGYKRVKESRDIKYLDKIVSNSNALKAFRNGVSLSDAVQLTDEPQTVFKNSLNRALDQLKIAQQQIHFINKPTIFEIEKVDELDKLVKDVLILLKVKANG
jgi:hypothetical protein